MKYLAFGLISLFSLCSSCDWYVFQPRKYSTENRPIVCNKVFEDSKISPGELDGYSVEELLVIQKCGLAYIPEQQISWDIANQKIYPVPALVQALRTDVDEYFRYNIILDFVALTKSDIHREHLLSDRDLVLGSVSESISRMKDATIKNMAEGSLDEIKSFYSIK